MLLGLHKNLTFNSGMPWPYATGGDYVYLYEDTTTGKTYRVHEFLSTGTSTLNVEVGGQMDILVVGGGGSGGVDTYATTSGAGGGAGKFLEYSGKISAGTHTVTVGSGGPAVTRTTGNTPADPGPRGKNGNPSSFVTTTLTLTATGGGGGGGGYWGASNTDRTRFYPGLSGGCGGGAAGLSNTIGLADSYTGDGTAYGNNGGAGSAQRHGGGGGGANSNGGNATTTNGGNGGAGRQWLNGNYYAGGGGGGAVGSAGSVAGSGGIGGGGAGSLGSSATSASANTGGGGGGAGGVGDPGTATSGAGGSGIVIVRYVVAEKKLWTPSELGSSLQGWWDFSDTSTLYGATSGGSNVTENDSEILRVEDKSGNGIHLPKATNITSFYTGNIAPNILKTNAQNGLSVFEVDKVNNPNPSTYIGGGFGTQNVPIGSNVSSLAAIWIDYAGGVIGQYNGGVFKLSDGVAANGGNYRLTQDWPDSTTVHVWRGMAGNDSTSTLLSHARVNFGSGAWRINVQNANYTQPTNSLRIFVNGNTTASASADSAGFTSNTVSASAKFLQIGQSTYSNQQANYARGTSSKLGEIMFVSEDLATDVQTRQKLEGYLAHKWGLTNNLPAGHPYKYEPPYKVEPEEIVTDGLVLNLDAGDYASYPRSGTTWYDISGNGLNGTLTNGPTYDSANKGSIVFDGSGDYVNIPDQNILDISSNNITIEVIFKNNDLPSSVNGDGLLSKGSGSNNGVYELLLINRVEYNGKFALYFRCGSVGTFNPGDILLNTNTIYHAVGVMDNGIMKTYVNGIAENASLTASGNIPTSTYPITLGTRELQKNTDSSKLNGNIYVARVYNRALSSTEISQNFNALRGRYGI